MRWNATRDQIGVFIQKIYRKVSPIAINDGVQYALN
jgi:hypothetical protein